MDCSIKIILLFWLFLELFDENGLLLVEKSTVLKGGYPIIIASNIFPNSHLIQKCIQNQQNCIHFRIKWELGKIFDTKMIRWTHFSFLTIQGQLQIWTEHSSLWHYGLWSFQTGFLKLERFLHKNQHTQRKCLNFENWTSGEPQ